MTSQNNSLTTERGSALIVTMLLVSVLLVAALILLQRIIPYAKSVRSMHDASQAYYVARGQTDIARMLFLYDPPLISSLGFPSFFQFLSTLSLTSTTTLKASREDLFSGRTGGTNTARTENIVKEDTDLNTSIKTILLALPFINVDSHTKTSSKEAYAVSSKSGDIPLKIKLFPTDNTTKNFGTSKKTGTDAGKYHTLYARNAGGLRFDLRGVDTSNSSFTFGIKGATSGTVTLKIQYYPGGNADVKTFTAEYPITGPITFTAPSSPSLIEGNIQSINNSGSISTDSKTLRNFLTNVASPIDCRSASICSLTLTLNSGGPSSIDFQLISDQQIPDLNAVVIGDGLSKNGLYYQRIIDLIPTPQDI